MQSWCAGRQNLAHAWECSTASISTCSMPRSGMTPGRPIHLPNRSPCPLRPSRGGCGGFEQRAGSPEPSPCLSPRLMQSAPARGCAAPAQRARRPCRARPRWSGACWTATRSSSVTKSPGRTTPGRSVRLREHGRVQSLRGRSACLVIDGAPLRDPLRQARGEVRAVRPARRKLARLLGRDPAVDLLLRGSTAAARPMSSTWAWNSRMSNFGPSAVLRLLAQPLDGQRADLVGRRLARNGDVALDLGGRVGACPCPSASSM